MVFDEGERGTTLIEAVVAGALLVTLATGSASLILLAHRLGVRAEQLMAATAVATARLQVLHAIPFAYDSGGVTPEVAALAPSPGNVLDTNTAGSWDTTDDSGRQIGMPGAGPPAFVRRWAIWPLASAAVETCAIEVCVFAWPVQAAAPPLTCLQSARTRQP